MSRTIKEKSIISHQFVKAVEILIRDGHVKSKSKFGLMYGHSKSFVSHITAGEQDVTVDILYKVVKDFKLNPAFFFDMDNFLYL